MKKQFRRQTISLLRLWAIVVTRSEWIACGRIVGKSEVTMGREGDEFSSFHGDAALLRYGCASESQACLKRISVRWGIVAGTDGDAVHALRSF